MILPSGRRARVWLTVLDALIISGFAAALVIALGGRTRFRIAGARVLLQSPWNVVIAAGACTVLRVLVAGLARPLPWLDGSSGWMRRLEDERRRLAEPAPFTRRVAWFAAAAVAGSTVWVVPHLLHIRYVPDPGDPVFSAWRLAALAHQLTTDPRHLWDGNIFYPLPLTLTYSDSLFLQSLLGLPFLVAGADPLVVMNALMVLSFPARGLAFFVLGWRLTGRPDAALVAALIGAWSPFYLDHYSQLELQSTAFVPLVLLFSLRTLAAPTIKRGLALGGLLALQCLACMYVAVMLVSFLVPFLFMLAVAWRPWRSSGWVAAGIAAVLVVTPVAGALGAAYMKSREVHGDRSIEEVSLGSALPSDYGHASFRLASYRWQSRDDHHHERDLLPGASSLALGAAALVAPLTPAAVATLTAGAAAFDWSLGLKGLTYDDLYKRLPPYRGMRVASRFSAMVDTALAVLAAIGCAWLLRGRFAGTMCAALCVIVLIDLRMDLGLQPYLPTVPAIYERVNPSMVLAELPQGHSVDYMYFSTRHWARLLNGYSGFFPDLHDLNTAQDEFPAETAVRELHRLGATHLTYNCAFARMNGQGYPDCGRVFDALAANPTLEEVATERWMGADVRLYRYR